jgi:hypothetical protein
MYKETIEKMHSLQRTRLKTIGVKDSRLSLDDGPATKQSGLYWIYTTHSNKDLLSATPSSKRGSINFAEVISRHADLSNVCTDHVGEYRLVYNGIGGTGSKGKGGLRERIMGEFRGGEGTGSLAIRGSSLDSLDRWRYSYVLWSEIEFPNSHEYGSFSEIIERLWRIHFGWPILCTR